MDIYGHIARHLVLPLWARWEKSPYLSHFAELLKSQYMPVEKLEVKRLARAKTLIAYAMEHSPFYKEKFRGFNAEELKSVDDLRVLPVTSKEEVRERGADIRARNMPETAFKEGLTSGSTGQPLRFKRFEGSAQWVRAAVFLTNTWAGWVPGQKIFSLFGRSTDGPENWRSKIRKKLLYRNTNLSTFSLTPDSMRKFQQKLSNTRLPFIFGYAHALDLLARFLEREGLSLKACGIISGGMVLHPWQRKKIERVFDCKVLDRYGSEEVGAIACECGIGEGLHVLSPIRHVEVIKNSREGLSETGHLVVTDLTSLGFPLIRYMTGDLGCHADGPCSCGRSFPLISRIEGRESDFIYSREKGIISGVSLSDNFGAMITGAEQVQLVQDRIDHILIRIKTATEPDPRKIRSLVELYFGTGMGFSMERVSEIPLEPSGKVSFVKSLLDKELLP